MTYLEFDFLVNPPQPGGDILLAALSELGFESFVEKEDGLLAYIQKTDFAPHDFEQLPILKHPDIEITWSKKEIEQQNWNKEWEKNFRPIQIGKTLSIRAPFHPKENVKYDIVIEPKMSFGTGHHETTHMMLQQVLKHNFESKRVLDMGCGTGVLAIMTEKKGAAQIDAIDNDTWCYENSLENVARNQCKNIKVWHGDATLLKPNKYDVILANINRNILLRDLPIYAQTLQKKGVLFLSGFYNSDLAEITKKCEALGLSFEKNLEMGEWVSAKYVF